MENNGFKIDRDIFGDTQSENQEKSFSALAFSADDLPERTLSEKEKKAEQKMKKKSNKKRRAGRSFVVVLFIIIICVAVAFTALYAGADYLGIGFSRGKACVMVIPEGASTAEIADALYETGAVKIPALFRLYSKYKHYDGDYKCGTYTFNSDLGYEDLAAMLKEGGVMADYKKITIIEGWDVDRIAKTLEEKGVCTRADFIDQVQSGNFDYDFIKDIPENEVYYRLEGYLFPDTYEFPIPKNADDSKDCAWIAVNMMLENFENKTKDVRKYVNKNSEYTFHETVTMASMVELEANISVTDMPKVAAVFFNRLESDEFACLQSDPTMDYPHSNDRYNTYKCFGLPPGPLCSAGLDAIEAAAHPEKNSDNYFFVTDTSGKFYYTKTLDDHDEIINRLDSEGKWHREEE